MADQPHHPEECFRIIVTIRSEVDEGDDFREARSRAKVPHVRMEPPIYTPEKLLQDLRGATAYAVGIMRMSTNTCYTLELRQDGTIHRYVGDEEIIGPSRCCAAFIFLQRAFNARLMELRKSLSPQEIEPDPPADGAQLLLFSPT